MSIYATSPLARDKPLEFPEDPEAYELRLLEDDAEEYYLPLYEIAALDRKKRFGEFDVDMVAFCKVRRYTTPESALAPNPKGTFHRGGERKLFCNRRRKV